MLRLVFFTIMPTKDITNSFNAREKTKLTFRNYSHQKISIAQVNYLMKLKFNPTVKGQHYFTKD